ncbi:MAG: hypothetical protein HOV81_36230 [Kofleriaceae bacterium]|nr:hypothetical protein [Kofleriaceae bacterium]
MRAVCVLGLVCVTASQVRAEVSIGASVGAGAQGDSTYSAIDLRLDVAFEHAKIGLGARGVWEDEQFRTSDWSAPERALTIIRALEAHYAVGETTLAIAGGALAPSHVGTIVDGYRVALDDRWRTGVRAGIRNEALELGIEVDDVLDPAVVAASTRYLFSEPWGMHAGLAVDPDHGSALEVGGHRVYEGDEARAELGVSVVAELAPGEAARGGASAVAYATSSIAWHDITWSARGDVRAGTGSVGGLFGPLYRIERVAHDGEMSIWDRHRGGAGAGLSLGATGSAGWIELGARARPDLPDLLVASAGAPMGRWLQAAVWAAASRGDAAGAGELRVAWQKRLFSALQAARLYRFDVEPAMQPHAIWSVTAWFGVASE